jgi:hypothetical protein
MFPLTSTPGVPPRSVPRRSRDHETLACSVWSFVHPRLASTPHLRGCISTRRMKQLLLALAYSAAFSFFVAGVTGCTSSDSYVTSKTWTCRIMSREITLSHAEPEDTDAGIRLIHVRNNGSVTIRKIRSGKTYSAMPNGYFAREGFGRYGLFLISSSPRRGSATFQLTWTEH